MIKVNIRLLKYYSIRRPVKIKILPTQSAMWSKHSDQSALTRKNLFHETAVFKSGDNTVEGIHLKF